VVEQLIERRARAGVPLLVDLVLEPGTHRFRQGRCLRTARNHLDEVVPTLRHGIGTGVHAHAKSPTREFVDRAARPLAAARPPRHTVHDSGVRVTNRVMPRIA
jgi:hypothetical protein